MAACPWRWGGTGGGRGERGVHVIAFGPVPSRRLGKSLGINHIPPKMCTYSCVYCQLGRTTQMQVERQAFYPVDEIVRAVEEQLRRAVARDEAVDYMAFVPDGEPTLDANLGRAIEALRPLGVPIAVISNASLLSREDVRADLMGADWVSLKVDAADEQAWRRVDRPHGRLDLAAIQDGAQAFARSFQGTLVSETMLVAGVNDGPAQIEAIAHFLGKLRPATAYLAVPTRPPAEAWVHVPDEGTLNRAYQILSATAGPVEYLIGYEGDAFAFTGDVEADLLSITAVHPMREDAVRAILARAGAKWEVVTRLVEEGELVVTLYCGHHFYVRKLR
jgi:wyosine [tRNA(Phe)-imidazoG37] synthetase (radical SAM superfamily)